MTLRKLINMLEEQALVLGDDTIVEIATSYRDSDEGRLSLEDEIVGTKVVPAVKGGHWPKPASLLIVGDDYKWVNK